MNPCCPYCGEPQEINHDDGYGYSEDEIYQQQCGDCEKHFTYQTRISFSYDLEQAPCLNGANHEFKATFTIPVEYTKMECEVCGERREPTDAELIGARNYHETLRLKIAAEKAV